MDEFKITKSIGICNDICDLVVTQYNSEVGSHLRKGAVLLGIANSPYPDDEYQFRFCIGWPKSKGEVPEWFKDITE